MSEKKTIGKISTELIKKDTSVDHSPIEQMRESLTDYDSNIYECIERGKRDYSRDFYVVVITKKERLMPNVLRNYFTNRLSCPTPQFDQAVYKYNYRDEIIEFLWVIPAKDICEQFLNNALLVDDSQKELLSYIVDFVDGTLDRKSMILNGEIITSITTH